jgi:hypothetical protein
LYDSTSGEATRSVARQLHGGAENAPADPALARLVEAWPRLPEHIRAAVLALVGAGGLAK